MHPGKDLFVHTFFPYNHTADIDDCGGAWNHPCAGFFRELEVGLVVIR
jgi:hypothetical protein